MAKKRARKRQANARSKGKARPKARSRARSKARPRKAARPARPRAAARKRSKPARRAAATQEPRRPLGLDRARRKLSEADEPIPGPPSSLDLDQSASAAKSGRREIQEALHQHTETSPALTGGDVDADWQDAYAVGDEAPGGDNPTPDQDRVDDIGRALGVEYEDNEELKGAQKIEKRDRNRWELDPASAEDYKDRK
jgi:Family of unknown function (DUF6335)